MLLHTWSDKAAGIAVGVGLVGSVLVGRRAPLVAATTVAALAAVEELYLVATARRTPDADAPGVLGSLASRLVAPGAIPGAKATARPVGYDVS